MKTTYILDCINVCDLSNVKTAALEDLRGGIDELAALAQRVTELETALRPLASVAVAFDTIRLVDDKDGLWTGTTKAGERLQITIGDARRARALLKKEGEG